MVEDYFPATYCDGRARFLSACLDARAPVASYRNPHSGPEGEALFTDAALIGRADAGNVVVVTSSTHGVEGFAGSGIQVGLLRDPRAPKPPPDTALLLIHTLNPHGMAWLRRENEDNVDLNRNFVDHEGGDYPENDLFEELVEHLVPKVWDDGAYERYKAAIGALNDRYGEVPVRKAMHKGQYRHPDSIHYGGSEATWSNRTLGRICSEFLGAARRGAMIDVHTGLGPYGYGELMTRAGRESRSTICSSTGTASRCTAPPRGPPPTPAPRAASWPASSRRWRAWNGRRWGWNTAPGSASTCAAACSPMLGCMPTARWTATSGVRSSGT